VAFGPFFLILSKYYNLWIIMRLNHRNRARPRDRQIAEKPRGKMMPFTSGLLLSGALLLLPMEGKAEAAKCSAKSASGDMSSFVSSKGKAGKAPTSLRISIPSPVKGKHIVVSFPDRYTKGLYTKASKLEGTKRTDYISRRIAANLQLGEAKLGSRTKVSFRCVPLTGRIGTIPVPRLPEKAPSKTPPPEKASPEPSKSDKAAPPSGGGRRRVIDFGDTGQPQSKARPAKPPVPPIPSAFQARLAGGKGSHSEPMVVTVPIPAKGKDGRELHEYVSPLVFQKGDGGSLSMRVKVRFVGARPENDNQKTSRNRLEESVKRGINQAFRTYLTKQLELSSRESRQILATASSVLSKMSASAVSKASKSSSDVSTYLSR
jgi:hypothetical protein